VKPDPKEEARKSLFTLIGELPELVTNLIKAEIEQLKQQLTHKVKFAGIGIGLFVAAAVLLFFAVGVLIAAAILGLAVVLPPWLAALIVFAFFVIVAAVLAFLGLRFFKKMGQEPSTGESLKKDVDAVKGLGEYGEH